MKNESFKLCDNKIQRFSCHARRSAVSWSVNDEPRAGRTFTILKGMPMESEAFATDGNVMIMIASDMRKSLEISFPHMCRSKH